MSQAPRGKNDWIRDHYEKAILLAALVALLVSCALLVQWIQTDKDAAQPSLSRLDWKGAPIALHDTVPFDNQIAAARAAATNVLVQTPRLAVSPLRVACVKCGKPIDYEANECPFCLAPQPKLIDPEKQDTDGDGIPDKFEQEWGLDALNPADATGDLDGDGFTNLEEHSAGTDPRNPQDSPDPIVKLRVAAIRPVPFVLRYVGTQRMPDGSLRFLLNLQSLERSYFAKLNDVILGYKVAEYDPAGKLGETLTMVRQADKRPVALVKGRPVTEQELAILFVFLVDRSRLPVQRLNDVFALRGAEYKVVDIRRESVIIQNVKTAEKVTVPLLSAEERAAPAAQTNAVPAAPAAAPVW